MYRFWNRLQYRRYRYQTDTTGIGPIPIPSTGIGLSLVKTVLSASVNVWTVQQWHARRRVTLSTGLQATTARCHETPHWRHRLPKQVLGIGKMCLVRCTAYYWFRLRKETGYGFQHFWLAFHYSCCLFSVTYCCICGRCGRIVLFSVSRDGNQGLENAIFRPWKAKNKELRSLFSIPGDGQLAYSMLFSDPKVWKR